MLRWKQGLDDAGGLERPPAAHAGVDIFKEVVHMACMQGTSMIGERMLVQDVHMGPTQHGMHAASCICV